MTGALLAGLLAGYGIAMPVGAVATYLVTLTARTSARVGAAGALGVASADGLYALIAVIGGAALTGVIARIAGPLRWASAVVLIVLAVRIAWTAIRDHRSGELAAVGGFDHDGRSRLRLAARHHPAEPGDGAVFQCAGAGQPGERAGRRRRSRRSSSSRRSARRRVGNWCWSPAASRSAGC